MKILCAGWGWRESGRSACSWIVEVAGRCTGTAAAVVLQGTAHIAADIARDTGWSCAGWTSEPKQGRTWGCRIAGRYKVQAVSISWAIAGARFGCCAGWKSFAPRLACSWPRSAREAVAEVVALPSHRRKLCCPCCQWYAKSIRSRCSPGDVLIDGDPSRLAGQPW